MLSVEIQSRGIHLTAARVTLTGQVTEQCIPYPALGACVRHFSVVVPSDAVGHIDPELKDAALKIMQRNVKAEIKRTEQCLS